MTHSAAQSGVEHGATAAGSALIDATGEVPSAARLPVAQVHPITDDDLDEVGRFLGAHFPPDTPGDEWGEAWRRTVNRPGSGAPNHGFLLRAAGVVVGAYPCVYSTRVIDGRPERFCNLAVWYVAPEYRLQSISLQRAVLTQPGYTFTDLSPSEPVQKINLRLGFQYLATDTALLVNTPWVGRHRVRVSADPSVITAALPDPVKSLYIDHADCRWARHLVLTDGDESCYLQWRMTHRRRLPVAWLQYASNPVLLRRGIRTLTSHFLLRHRAPFTMVELRVAGGRLQPSIVLPNHRGRMFRSRTLPAEHIDYLYSELTSVP